MLYRFQSLKIWVRIIIISSIFMVLIGSVTNFWIGYEQSKIAIQQSEEFAESIHQMTLAGLTTLMVTGNIKDREIFLEQIRHSNSVDQLKVLRAEAIDKQYGENSTDDKAQNQIELDVLQSGIKYSKVTKRPEGEFLYVVTPILSSTNYLGKNCIACHFVSPGTVLGAVSMEIPLSRVNLATNQFRFKLFFAGLFAFIIVIVGIYLFIKLFITNPLSGVSRALVSIENGDLTHEIHSSYDDEVGMLKKGLESMRTKLALIVSNMNVSSQKASHSSTQVAHQSEVLNKSAQNLAESNEREAAAIEQLSASINLIAESSRSSSQGMKNINEGIVQLNTSSDGLKKSMLDLNKRSSQLEQDANDGTVIVEEATEAMFQIQNISVKITDIIKLISDISDKTNLLSLNAAIEAARAGESGRGFAVVADEISELASRTLKSVKDITSLIHETTGAVQTGSHQVGKLAKSFQSIKVGVEKINGGVSNSFTALQSQVTQAQQMTVDTRKMTDIAIEIEKSTQEQNISMEEINNSSQKAALESQSVLEAAKELLLLSEQMVDFSRELTKQATKFKVKK